MNRHLKLDRLAGTVFYPSQLQKDHVLCSRNHSQVSTSDLVRMIILTESRIMTTFFADSMFNEALNMKSESSLSYTSFFLVNSFPSKCSVSLC